MTTCHRLASSKPHFESGRSCLRTHRQPSGLHVAQIDLFGRESGTFAKAEAAVHIGSGASDRPPSVMAIPYLWPGAPWLVGWIRLVLGRSCAWPPRGVPNWCRQVADSDARLGHLAALALVAGLGRAARARMPGAVSSGRSAAGRAEVSARLARCSA